MALIKSQEQASGVVGEYWRVTSVKFDLIADMSKIEMSMYLNAEARQAGKPPVVTHAFEFSGEENPLKPAAMRDADAIALAYAKMKQVSDFSGATDA